MLDIIVYEDNENFMKKNIETINKALGNDDIEYKIYKFTSYTDELNNLINDKELKKLFILDIEAKDVSGLEVAAKIREEDFESIIIFVTAYNKYQDDIFYSRLMVLDFVSKYKGYERRLEDDIIAAVKIIYNKKTFNFTYNHINYRLPYNNIYFIEKEPMIKRCVIYTFNNKLYISKSINWLEKNLPDFFVKTHQSCIVNTNNIKYVDYSQNKIFFENEMTTGLLTSDKKKVLKEYVSNS